MIRDPNTFRQEYKRAEGWWEDGLNAKQVSAVNLSWNTTYGGWTFTNVSNRYLWVNTQMQHAKRLGSLIYPHVHWQPTTVVTDTVQWLLEYWYLNSVDGGAQGAVGTTETITVTPNGTAYQMQIDYFTPVVAPASEAVSAFFICKLSRVGLADAYNDDVILKDFDPHIQLDQPGSIQETSKWG